MMFKDKSFNSSFSLNVNTGNEMYNPIPIKPKMDERPPRLSMQPSVSIKEQAPVEYEITNDRSKNLPESHILENPVDTGDNWVRSQAKVFDQNNYNWNQEVEGLLDEAEEELHPTPSQKPKDKRSSKANEPAKVNIRRHRKKSKKQLEVLESYFDLDVEWSLELVEKLSTELDLEKDQVYKWNWDKRKRLRKKMNGKTKSSTKGNKRQKTD